MIEKGMVRVLDWAIVIGIVAFVVVIAAIVLQAAALDSILI